jgi:hypothetical protein
MDGDPAPAGLVDDHLESVRSLGGRDLDPEVTPVGKARVGGGELDQVRSRKTQAVDE